jgi:hypothetical protein
MASFEVGEFHLTFSTIAQVEMFLKTFVEPPLYKTDKHA